MTPLEKELAEALERVMAHCESYLEDQPAPEEYMFDSTYVRPEEQARKALEHAKAK